jgi:hypothetical protein
VRFVLLVVLAHHLFRRKRAVGSLEAEPDRIHTGKVVDAVRGADAQCLPARLPGAARERASVEHDELLARIETESLKIVRNREPGLPAADHDY